MEHLKTLKLKGNFEAGKIFCAGRSDFQTRAAAGKMYRLYGVRSRTRFRDRSSSVDAHTEKISVTQVRALWKNTETCCS